MCPFMVVGPLIWVLVILNIIRKVNDSCLLYVFEMSVLHFIFNGVMRGIIPGKDYTFMTVTSPYFSENVIILTLYI